MNSNASGYKRYTQPGINVIGIGGAGVNMLSYLYQNQIDGIEYVFYDKHYIPLNRYIGNQSQSLQRKKIDVPGVEGTVDNIDSFINTGTRVALVVAGMGGETGTVATPRVARLCKERGLFVIGFVATPFDYEGERRKKIASDTLYELEKFTDILIVVSNNKLRELYGELPFDQAFAVPESILLNSIQSIADHFYCEEYRDYRKDFKAVFISAGINTVGYIH